MSRIQAFIPVVFLLAASSARAADERRDPKAVEVARAVMQAMGGEDAWRAAHFVRFDFKVDTGGKVVADRAHLWDKMTGNYRLEGKTKDGKLEVTLFNIGTQQGTAYADGKKLEGSAALKAVKDAYAAFINDMYWLAMPWKMLDPGVNLKYIGKQTRNGAAGQVVRLTFNRVGLTPGDRYDAFVSDQSHLMTHWDYKLQSGDSGAWDWQYGDSHGIKLASNHTSAKMSINMGNVRVLDQVDAAYFSDAQRTLAQLP